MLFSERFCFGSFLCALFCPADWAMRWIGSDATFGERLVAFAAVEVRARMNSFSAQACAQPGWVWHKVVGCRLTASGTSVKGEFAVCCCDVWRGPAVYPWTEPVGVLVRCKAVGRPKAKAQRAIIRRQKKGDIVGRGHLNNSNSTLFDVRGGDRSRSRSRFASPHKKDPATAVVATAAAR